MDLHVIGPLATPAERAAAPVLNRALDLGAQRIAEGASPRTARTAMRRVLGAQPLARVQSIDIRDAVDLSPVASIARPVVILLAVRMGDVLLIDERVAQPQGNAHVR